MRFLVNQKTKLFFRNSLVSLLLAVICLFSIAPVNALAQTQPPTPSQTTTQPTTTTPDTVAPTQGIGPNGEVTVPTPTGAESGQVQAIGDWVGGLLGCLGSPIDCAKGALGATGKAMLAALISFFDFISDLMFDLIAKIIIAIMHLVAAALGSDTSEACVGDAEACKQAGDALSQIDPLFKEGNNLIGDFNVFTVVDSSYNSLYNSLPKSDPVTELKYFAQENVLGIETVNAQAELETEGVKDLGGLIRELWAKMRDLAYVASVIVLIVIGFMILLRRRLDPKTVVTATNSLPKVAIALILITFSFAISSLFVDFIHVTVALTANYFGGIGGLSDALAWASDRIGGGEFTWLPVMTLFSRSVITWGAFKGLIAAAASGVLIPGGQITLILAIPLIAALLIDIIVRIGLLILAIMLFWSLLIRYATLIMLTVFGPFFFLAGAIPGYESLTVNWFKRMAAIVVSFPAILIIVYIALALLTPFSGSGNSIGTPPPLQSAANVLNISSLVGLGILYFAHKVPGVIDDAFGIKDTKQKGPQPLFLVGAGMAGLQSYGTINKAFPNVAGNIWKTIKGKAGGGGGAPIAGRPRFTRMTRSRSGYTPTPPTPPRPTPPPPPTPPTPGAPGATPTTTTPGGPTPGAPTRPGAGRVRIPRRGSGGGRGSSTPPITPDSNVPNP